MTYKSLKSVTTKLKFFRKFYTRKNDSGYSQSTQKKTMILVLKQHPFYLNKTHTNGNAEKNNEPLFI